MSWIRTRPDNLVLAAFLLIFLLIAVRRLDYAGDGLRHLDHILHSSRPALGEPRWLLFPLVLFLVVKPFVAAGIVQSIGQGARVFCLFDAACGFLYLLCLRRWLLALAPAQRAAIIALAGGSAVFLTLTTDTIEPSSAVLIAVAGLTFARFRDGLSDGNRLAIATASFAVASLIYQGLLFGLFFLPAVFPLWFRASRQTLLRVALLLLTVPVISIVLLWMGGDTPGNAMRRLAQGEGNPAVSRQFSKVSAKNIAGVLIVGPAYAFASIPELRGLSGSLKMLRHSETVFDGIRGAAAWCGAAAAILIAIGLLVFRKQYAILFAFAGMMILPALRMSQYAYLKYYVLLPLLVVLVVPRLGVRFVWPALLGSLLLLSNVAQVQAQNSESRALRLRIARELQPQLPSGTCFLTSAWGPPVPWPAEFLAWQHILNAGLSGSPEQISRANSLVLKNRLRKLFCSCPAVVTETFIQPETPLLQQDLSYFGISGIPLPKLVIPSPEQSEIFHAPAFTVYRFSREDQRQACEALGSENSGDSVR